MNAPSPVSPSMRQRWSAFSAAAVQGFHVYASWLVSITWKRFAILAVVLMIGVNILQEIPPFSIGWRVSEDVEIPLPKPPKPAKPAKPAKAEKPRDAQAPAPAPSAATGEADDGLRYEIQIDGRGVRIVPRAEGAASGAASGAAAAGASGTSSAAGGDAQPIVDIRIPDDLQREAVRDAVEDARRALEQAAAEVRKAQSEAAQEVLEAQTEAEEARRELADAQREVRYRTKYRTVRLGDFLNELALLIVLASALVKATYKGRIQAEVKAAKATEAAEAESLRRQVVEARMAAMQAQVEPHFLFNTLASIDHLIETDPPRASQMQRNLIALLRASMPTMREANANGGVRDLGREMAVIRPYLEILQVRMEERLQPRIDVPDGLLSAEFPPMMIQGLVENAIKHGLEPKAEGGSLLLKAEVVHGKLSVTVADTGLGFGRAATSGTGVGLANIRERLSLLYGKAASVTVAENQPSGTIVTITVPYRTAQTHDTPGASADAPRTPGAH